MQDATAMCRMRRLRIVVHLPLKAMNPRAGGEGEDNLLTLLMAGDNGREVRNFRDHSGSDYC